MRTYENYANIPLRYSIDSFHNSQRGNPLDPQKTKGITMSEFIMIKQRVINTQFIKEINFIEHDESWSIKFILVGEDDPVEYQGFNDKKSYENSKRRLMQELDIVIV